MSSIAQTQPRTGRRNFTLRAYLAGTAATVALLGAVVVVFASLGAYVAFNGLPIGGDQAASEATSVEVGAPATQTKATQAHHQLGASATAAHQSNGGAINSSSHHAGDGSDTGGASSTDTQETASPASPASPTGTNTETVSADGSGTTVTAGPSQDPPSNDSGSPLPTPNVTTPDSVGSTLGTVEQTLHGAGVDIPLSQAGAAADQVTDGLLGGD